MSRKCIIFSPTGLCTNVIEDQFDTYVPDQEFSIAPDNTGEIGWTWDGDQWINPAAILNNAYLGQFPSAETPEVDDESTRLATTFYVRQKIENYITNIFLPNLVLDGGDFGDAAASITYDAGFFDDTGLNISDDLHATLFDDTGGNLTSNVYADTF